jgi:type I restriction enzyme S subunit
VNVRFNPLSVAARDGLHLRPLGQLIEFRNEIVHPKDHPHGTVTFVGLEHIESDTGIRIGSEQIRLEEMTGRRARFRAGDILYGYLRPYLNKVWIAEFGGICSVDQYVLKVRSIADRNYVAQFLRSAAFLKTAPVDLSPGQLPRIRSGEIAATPIPLPPLHEQQRLADILDQADDLRRKRRHTIAALGTLATSVFIELFENSCKFEVQSFEEIVSEVKIGLVRSSKEFGEEFPFPYVRMDAITKEGEFDESRVLRTFASQEELKGYQLKKGDFLFNTRNSRELVGKSALFSGGVHNVFNNNIMRIRFKSTVLPEYVAAAFQRPTVQAQIDSRKSGTTSVFAVYWRELKTLPLPIPPLDLQRAFAARIAEIEKLKSHHRAHLAQLDALFASLQHRAFRGEL